MMNEKNPYVGLGEQAFWRTAVAARSPFDIAGLWRPKFRILPEDAVCTYGSCFAQHIGRALRDRAFTWHVAEAVPVSAECPCPESVARAYNYGIFSARTGNIYTTSLLRQWASWAVRDARPPEEVWMSAKGDSYIDPLRPAIEPEGFPSAVELYASRQHAIDCFHESLVSSKFLVFTMGLTESWHNRLAGYEYAVCPGTIAGAFDANRDLFVNQDYVTVLDSLSIALTLVRRINPSIRVILTVSPIPLTATASGSHVLVATMHSKSILRAVAGHVAATCEWVDYFPSYEIINSPPFGGMFFQPNKRSVHPDGVAFVMNAFFEGLQAPSAQAIQASKRRRILAQKGEPGRSDDVCEEALLDAFGPGA